MAVYQYAEQFTQFLAQKYEKEPCSDALMHSNPQITFLNAQTIKLPRLTLSGYKDHTRTAGFNAGTISNDWEPKKLAHDRDIEFFVDPMDIDETNLALSVANIRTPSRLSRQSLRRTAITTLSFTRSSLISTAESTALLFLLRRIF